MSSTTGSRFLSGKVTGTGADLHVPLQDFTPRKVVLRNVAAGDELTWTDSMVVGGGFKRLTAGTGSYITSLGVTPVDEYQLDSGQTPPRGFTIGADTDINVSAEVIHWEAWE